MSEPIPEVYGRDRLLAFLRKYLLGGSAGHAAPVVSATNVVGSIISFPPMPMDAAINHPSMSFIDLEIPAGKTLTIAANGYLVVKDFRTDDLADWT